MKKLLMSLLIFLFTGGVLYAGGFNIYEFGGKSSAMGGAVVARAWDGSTIFYNPSGLAFLRGTQFYGGTTLIFPAGRFVGAAPLFSADVYKTKNSVFSPIGVYFSHKFSEKLGAGIGVTNPFGLGVEWHDNFPGRGLSRNAQLQSFYVSPVIAFRVTPNLSLGGGVDFVVAHVKLERSVFIFDSPGSPGYEVGQVKLEGTSNLAVGFTASAMFRTDKLGLGVAYRHSIHNKFEDGDANFTIFDNLSVPNVAKVAQSILVDQKAKTALDFPNFISAGIYYQVLEKLGLEVDYVWFNWSVFDKISLDFPDDNLDQTIPEDYNDAWQFRVGANYALNDKVSLRAGYIYDKTPQPIQSVSPLLPDNNRNDFSFGIGYILGKYQIDLGYMLVDIGERSTVENGVGKNAFGFDGAYQSRADLIYGSIGINF
ncbi:MAG: hypothetical protein D6814_03075 [Calditrichaeota bacterium]|nr:MAG: hypothetical protein D6814_03075 [Calditrichota bacterium]